MKKAKKFLALIIAIIIIVLTAPMAFAYSYDFIGFGGDVYGLDYLDYMIYYSTVHTCNCPNVTHTPIKIKQELEDLCFADEPFLVYPEYIDMLRDPTKINEVPKHVLEAFFEDFDPESAEFALIDSYEIGRTECIIDTEVAMKAYWYTFCCNTPEEISALEQKLPPEWKEKAEASVVASEAILDATCENPLAYTQSDYNAAAADMIEYYSKLGSCLNGYHLYGETAIDNGDDTHIYTCSFCSETYAERHSYDYEELKCTYCGADKPEEPEIPEKDFSDYVPQTFFEKVMFFFMNLFIKMFGWLM